MHRTFMCFAAPGDAKPAQAAHATAKLSLTLCELILPFRHTRLVKEQ